jgi:hypothetical protein
MTHEPNRDSHHSANTITAAQALAVTHEFASTASTSRHDGWTPQRQRGFCEALAGCGSVEHAAQSVGMSREGAYRLRQRASGRAFALAWDAALLLARQRLIDDAFDLAFQGSVERHIRDGRVIVEKRRRDAKSVLATVERLGSNAALGSASAKAVAQDFEAFLDCMEEDAVNPAQNRRGAAANFIEMCADAGTGIANAQLFAISRQLNRPAQPRLPSGER